MQKQIKSNKIKYPIFKDKDIKHINTYNKRGKKIIYSILRGYWSFLFLIYWVEALKNEVAAAAAGAA